MQSIFLVFFSLHILFMLSLQVFVMFFFYFWMKSVSSVCSCSRVFVWVFIGAGKIHRNSIFIDLDCKVNTRGTRFKFTHKMDFGAIANGPCLVIFYFFHFLSFYCRFKKNSPQIGWTQSDDVILVKSWKNSSFNFLSLSLKLLLQVPNIYKSRAQT